MVVPFFVEKIWYFIPKIHLTYINHDKPKKHSYVKKSADRVFEEGYLRGYPQGEWHPYTRPMRPITMISDHDLCSRYYQIETLDGSDYYLCQHGVHVR